MAVSDSERRLHASLAAHESWANTTNRTERTAPALAAQEAKFLEQAEGDPVRAASLRKAHFARLALKSVQSRRKSRELAQAAQVAEDEFARLSGSAATLTPRERGLVALRVLTEVTP